MLLAQQQTNRSMEQYRKPRNNPTDYGQLIKQRRQDYTMEKRLSLQ